MQCNIDTRGRRARLIGGIVSCAIAVALGIGAAVIPANRTVLTILAVVMAALGAFQIVEGAIGWCAVRAMGFHTKM
jgi:hypothetical protein